MSPPDGIAATKAGGRPLAVLERLLKPERQRRPGEACEMCAAPIADDHPHLVHVENRNLLCACRACYLLFTNAGAGGGKYRVVPDRYRYDPSCRLTDAQWEALQIPVRVAFFFFNSVLGRIAALYPSPAGATESLLPLAAWREVVEANPQLAGLEADVEALLVYGRRGAAFECFIVPISACYELTGIVKQRWKGFDGGEEAWRAIDAFFAGLRAKSETVDGRGTS
jgi:hypothetical protein